MLDTIKAYGRRFIEAIYGATVTSVIVFCGVGLLLAIVAMAVDMRMIDVRQIHLAP